MARLLTVLVMCTICSFDTWAANIPTLAVPKPMQTQWGGNQTVMNSNRFRAQTDSPFSVVGDSGVPAMHAALLQDGRVMFLDKVESSTGLKLANGRFAYSSIYDPTSHQLVPVKVKSNAFCAAGGFLADGRLLAIGGNEPLLWLDPTVRDGLRAIQYATAQVLGDGRVFVAAGTANGTSPYAASNINPTYEVLDATGSSSDQNIPMDILVKNAPYWMYPFIHLMKDGTIFVFVSKAAQIFDVRSNRITKELPALNGLYRTYPNTGGSVMFALKPEQDHSPTIMICGGGGWQGIDSPSDNTCGIIQPLSSDPAWQITTMPEPRCMVEGVLLLDGTILWINGVSKGAQGFGLGDTAVFDALIFNPENGSWTKAGVSSIARVYHSVAIMLLDGTILVAGSNPNEMPIMLKDVDVTNQYRKYPTEMRLERWTPPYLQGKLADRRPTNIVIDQTRLKMRDASFKISFDVPTTYAGINVILYHNGFVTHSLHMGHIMVRLEVSSITADEHNRINVLTKLPDIALAPGPYVIYLMVDGVPGIGQFVSLKV